MKKQSKKSSKKLPQVEESLAVGGQAIIEGVMMRNKEVIAAAVRGPDGKIIKKKEHRKWWAQKWKPLSWPFIRGAISLFETMIVGMRIMMWSGSQSLGEDEEFSTGELIFSIAFAFIFSIGLFKLLPLFFASSVQNSLGVNNFLFNVLDGFAKIAILIIYMFIISRLKDVKRLFGYHGAEHKTINCYEAKKKLTVANVMKSSRLHPRCGTSFILFVFLVSIFVYMVIPLNVGFWSKLGLRVLFLPIIAGISYELIKLGGKHFDKPFVKILLSPGLALQRLTTNEPKEDQVEVAICSLKIALSDEK